MSEHKLKVVWKNNSNSMDYANFSRDHKWYFTDGLTINASSAPQFSGNSSFIDPEEAFVAAVSSCHMLTFLAICSKKRLIVSEYHDKPVGYLEKDENGKHSMTRVILNPKIIFHTTSKTPLPEEITKIHDKSHNHCFIANSVKTEILIS
ncbi:MAG: OsmC family peroxiredoxin [Candidatus Dadabacteria bacterium]|nr:OsmC family peroxiredoxin [Candidatus Dadabacteria bacterium]NIQ16631.1 OsmC family peroxiredoxin [Candidatus Dadabacteria bacterium]